MEKLTQKQIVLQHLKRFEGSSVNVWQAMNPHEYGGFDWYIADLAGVIRDIRRDGYDVSAIWCKTSTGAKYVNYVLSHTYWQKQKEEEIKRARAARLEYEQQLQLTIF